MLFCQCQAHVDLVCYYLQNTNYSSRCQQKLSPSLECSIPPPTPTPPVVCPDLSRCFYFSLVRGQWALPFWRGVFCLQVITVHKPVCTSRSNVNVNTDLARTTTNYLSIYLRSITGRKRKCKNMSWWHIKARVVYNKCFGWDHRWPHSDRVRKNLINHRIVENWHRQIFHATNKQCEFFFTGVYMLQQIIKSKGLLPLLFWFKAAKLRRRTSGYTLFLFACMP